MRKFMTVMVGFIFLALLVQGAASAQEKAVSTGDTKFDTQLKKLRDEAKADPEGFLRRVSERNKISEQELREAKEKHGLDEADTYMAAELARRTNRRVGDVAAEYEQNKGKGWGVMAQKMGIKPGSPEFKQMKADAKGDTAHMKAMAKNKKKMQEQKMKQEKARKTEEEGMAKGQGQGKGKGKKK